MAKPQAEVAYRVASRSFADLLTLGKSAPGALKVQEAGIEPQSIDFRLARDRVSAARDPTGKAAIWLKFRTWPGRAAANSLNKRLRWELNSREMKARAKQKRINMDGFEFAKSLAPSDTLRQNNLFSISA